MTADPASIEIVVDGQPLIVARGSTLAAGLANAGRPALRRSVSGEPRGAFCGMGICQECRVTIDGVPHRKACMVMVVRPMVVTRGSTDA